MDQLHPEWRQEVLDQLDQAAATLFPGPPNMNYPSAAVRLNAFRNASEWLLVFQTLTYGRPTGVFHEDWYGYGNKLEESGFRAGREAIQPMPGGDFWTEDEEERFLPELSGATVLVRGQPRHYAFDADQLSEIGLSDAIDMEDEIRFARAVAHVDLENILTPPDELPSLLGRRDLPLLFSMNGWHQPDSSEGELPSEVPCFQAIADCIANGSSTAPIECAGTANTHWSNWVKYE